MPQPQISDVAWLTGFNGNKVDPDPDTGNWLLPMEIGKWVSTGEGDPIGEDTPEEAVGSSFQMFGNALYTKLAWGVGELSEPAVSLDGGDFTLEFSVFVPTMVGVPQAYREERTVTTFSGLVRIGYDDQDGVGPDASAFQFWLNNVLCDAGKRVDVCLTYSSNTRYTLINGILRNTKNIGAPPGIEDTLSWGDPGSISNYILQFDEVRITKGALRTSDYTISLPHPRTSPPPTPSIQEETTDLSFPDIIIDANVGGHTRDPEEVFKRTEMETGTDRVRRVLTLAPHTVLASWTMNAEMLQTFYLWFENATLAGQESFYIRVADPTFDSGVAWFRARFAAPYQAVFNVDNDWLVSAELIIYGSALEARPPLSSLQGTSYIILNGEGRPDSATILEGTSTITLTGAGGLPGPVGLESTTTLALLIEGSIMATRALEGSSTFAMTITGELKNIHELESDTTTALVGTGDLA